MGEEGLSGVASGEVRKLRVDVRFTLGFEPANWPLRRFRFYPTTVANRAYAVALHVMYYNFVRIHSTLRMTPSDDSSNNRKPA